jgi:DNA replication protein DnaC
MAMELSHSSFQEAAEGKHSDELITDYAVLAIDDLGDEPTANRYGTKEETLSRVICDRYEVFCRHRVPTFISTNMTPAEIHNRYGARVADRIREMCWTINLVGESIRK